MKPVLIDTDILSLFFRKNVRVVTHFNEYLLEYRQLNISIINYYEILSGLKHRNAQKYLADFLEFTSCNKILSLTQKSVEISAEIYAKLRAKGTPVDDIDLLIAGVAMANNLVLVTHNVKHLSR
jgi:tRNA(fMet)-specific endonuclease VapC